MIKALRTTVVLAVTAMLSVGLVAITPPQPSVAADASQFDPGNIISDDLFYDSQAMSSASEIQQFLVNQVPVCRSSYACLTTYRTNTPTMSPVAGRCSGYDGRSSELAAEIIYRVGIACGISTKAMLVLLEKEQSLVTSSNPSKGRFEAATGMGCPDTAPCDPAYGGLFYQVYYAALQFKVYKTSPGSFNYVAGRVNSILYHPNRDCGASPVYIANAATAGLYNYTPYQPNAAALANLYGTGDSCSAYGNRNFWRIYTDWFGSTQTNTTGARAIAALYASLGGAGGTLGAQISDVSCFNSFRDCGVVYRAGSIYWSDRAGAFPVYDGIRAAYWNVGGSAGALGAPTSGPIAISANGGGTGQVFEKGSIYSSPATGAFPVFEPIRSGYFQKDGAGGSLGWPTASQICGAKAVGCTQSFQNGYVASPSAGTAWFVTGGMATAYRDSGGVSGSLGLVASAESPIAGNGGGTGQAFVSGSLFSSAAGLFAVTGPTRAAYFGLGGATGSLGWPTTASQCGGSGVCLQSFQSGHVVANPAGQTAILDGAIGAIYNASGGLNGFLGKPASVFIAIPQNGGGRGIAFDGGSIYDSSALGPFAVSGAIRGEYWRLGGSAGTVGWPTAAATCSSDGAACQQTFKNAVIYSVGKTVATISPQIAPGYDAEGGIAGPFGGATSDLIRIPDNGGGYGQVFQGGSIYSSGAGSFGVAGSIRAEYFRQSGAAGQLGWPTGRAACTGNVCSQLFQGGKIVSSGAGAFTLSGDFRTVFDAQGGETGLLGVPQSGVIAISSNGGGSGQVFANGSIFSSRSGTFAVSGAVRTEYFQQGGASGALGWPTGAATCSADSLCTQSFQNGTIVR